MSLRTNLSIGLVVLWAAHATAQSNLGELLDAGATKLSPEGFKEEVVQRVVTGPTRSGGTVELIYAPSGMIAGSGTPTPTTPLLQITGAWEISEEGKICARMRIVARRPDFPARCEYWYKLGEQYYLSDSDSDRHARVLRRTLKQ